MHVGRGGVGSGFGWAGGGVRCLFPPLWNGSSDFHTRSETTTKLEEETDADGSGRMFSSEGFLFIFLPLRLPFSLCLPLAFSPSVLLCPPPPQLANEFLTVP